MTKENLLNGRKKKILGAVNEAKQAGFDLTSDGLIAYLNGTLETSWAKELPFYGSLLSLSSKQGKNAIRTLIQRDYLGQRYDFSLEVYFLQITPKGEMEVPKPPKKKHERKTVAPILFAERKKQ